MLSMCIHAAQLKFINITLSVLLFYHTYLLQERLGQVSNRAKKHI